MEESGVEQLTGGPHESHMLWSRKKGGVEQESTYSHVIMEQESGVEQEST